MDGNGNPLAATFMRAARGQSLAGDAETVANVLRLAKQGASDRAGLVDNAAQVYAVALRDAIQGGSPPRATLQAFLDLLGVGRLDDAQRLVPDAGALPPVVRVAQETLRIWGTFTRPGPGPK